MPPKPPIRRPAAPKASAAGGAAQDVKPEAQQQDNGDAQATAGAQQNPSSDALPSDPIPHPSAPTPTPAAAASPSPAAAAAPSRTPSVQRLDTLNRPSIGSPAAAAASSRGGRGRGGKAVVAPKFAGRRSQTARAELEKAEQERKRVEAEQRAREEAARARREARRGGEVGRGGRGGGRGRGRGGYVGESERGREREQVASGPFSSGQVVADAGRRRMPVGGGGGGTFFGGGGGGGGRGVSGSSSGGGGRTFEGGRVKQDPGAGDVMMSSGAVVKMEDGGYVSSDEDIEEKGAQRQNVDDLVVIDLTQDDEDSGPMQGFAPVRLKREVHKDRTLGLNADGATTEGGVGSNEIGGGAGGTGVSEKKKGKGRAKDEVQFTGQSQPFQSTYSSSDEQEPRIKEEPTDDDDSSRPLAPEVPSMAEDPMLPQEPPSSPESKRKAKEKIKARTLSGSAPERPVYQTQEEIDEWERHQEDLRVLRSELGVLTVAPPPPPAADKDGDANMADGETAQQATAATSDKRADKVYLFQFPPVLPNLHPINVKPDPETAAPSASADAMDVDKAPPTSSTNPAHVPDTQTPGGPIKLPAGAVGKLRVHASGRATLDWGGTPLTLGMGTTASFLQDVLIASLPEEKKKGDERDGEAEGAKRAGVAMAMGQVKGKFVVTPDWDEILR